MRIRQMKRNSIISFFVVVTVFFTIVSCGSTPVPKPRGYYRIDFPEKSYRLFDSVYPFKFKYPVYGRVIPKEIPENSTDGAWLNIEFPKYKAKIHLSYKDVRGNLNVLTEDARKFAYKHTMKADAIDEQVFANKDNRVYGIIYDIRGNSASSLQFYVTDSVKHYIRGALYFRCEPNKDSLAPVIDFFSKDIVYMIESLRWK